jgi:hypothetical protein
VLIVPDHYGKNIRYGDITQVNPASDIRQKDGILPALASTQAEEKADCRLADS